MDPSLPQPADLTQAYAQLRGGLLAFLRKQVGDAQAAEDLLHDVMVKALAASEDGRPAPRNLTGWLYTVAHNAAMDHHRRRRPTEPLPDELADAPPAALAEVADETEAAMRELALCLEPLANRLPETYRDTVRAAEFEGRALRDIAQAQGISVAAAKQRASRGRRLLHRELMRCCSVALSPTGRLLDYDARAATRCATDPGACAGPTACATR
ncbi:ECF RNA polymerase sigma factor SigH [Burkholderiales bacterium]|nr:ECF RNA polymerase sigma factor SigH [Burkholderiales bacterium]